VGEWETAQGYRKEGTADIRPRSLPKGVLDALKGIAKWLCRKAQTKGHGKAGKDTIGEGEASEITSAHSVRAHKQQTTHYQSGTELLTCRKKECCGRRSGLLDL